MQDQGQPSHPYIVDRQHRHIAGVARHTVRSCRRRHHNVAATIPIQTELAGMRIREFLAYEKYIQVFRGKN
jgi:hypothetical protein